MCVCVCARLLVPRLSSLTRAVPLQCSVLPAELDWPHLTWANVGEPRYVANVPQSTPGLTWESLDMWLMFRGQHREGAQMTAG